MDDVTLMKILPQKYIWCAWKDQMLSVLCLLRELEQLVCYPIPFCVLHSNMRVVYKGSSLELLSLFLLSHWVMYSL